MATAGSLKDTLGKLNPFRYRGYVYDEETGLYYLRSRYYNPEWGRFVNADDTDTLFEEQDNLLENNLYAYCLCNPVKHSDDDGRLAIAIAASVSTANIWNPIGWVAVAVLAVAVVYQAAKATNPDPYGRAGQKKQGRERKAKARQKSNWKPRSTPKPPKKHTPGRDHRKYSKTLVKTPK